jgi:hypothetical protein
VLRVHVAVQHCGCSETAFCKSHQPCGKHYQREFATLPHARPWALAQALEGRVLEHYPVKPPPPPPRPRLRSGG